MVSPGDGRNSSSPPLFFVSSDYDMPAIPQDMHSYPKESKGISKQEEEKLQKIRIDWRDILYA